MCVRDERTVTKNVRGGWQIFIVDLRRHKPYAEEEEEEEEGIARKHNKSKCILTFVVNSP